MPREAESSREGSGGRLFSWPLLLILLLLGLALFGDRGVLKAIQASRQKEALSEQVRNLEASNSELRQEIQRLRSDPRYLESLARRDLGMVRKDERVYQFPAADPVPDRSPPAPNQPR